MQTKNIENTQDKLIKGLTTAADIITSSMGGGGSTVIINNNGKLLITKDGVSIAKNINLPDPIENIGAKLLISAAEKSAKATGDGTTLTSLLLKEMILNYKGVKELNKLKEEVKDLIKYIKENTIQVTSTEEIYKIAKTSANDDKLGKLFSDIYSNTSFDTKIELELSERPDTYFTIQPGYRYESGYVHPVFITNKDTREIIFEKPFIYVSEKPLHYFTTTLENLVKASLENDTPIIIIAEKFSDSVIKIFSEQKLSKGAKIALVKLEGYGEQKKRSIDDLKAYVDENGCVEKAIINAFYCTFFNSETPNLEKRLKSLKTLLNSSQEDIDAMDYEKRYYNLSGSVASIFVGGKTEEARKEEYDRIEDAVGAVKTAIEHGYVPGAGTLFYFYDKDHSVFSKPFKKILENAYIDYNNIPELSKEKLEGINVKTGQIVNLVKEGIIDPSLTLIKSLENALANTELVLNTKYTLYNE